jgi:hypothetical protein
MPYGDYGSYKTRTLQQRSDSDNKIFVQAIAMSGATAKAYYILAPYGGTVGAGAVGIGYLATAIFATGLASTSAAFYRGNNFFSFAEKTLASGDMGWFQTGGPVTSATLGTQSSSAGSYYCWCSATVSVFVPGTLIPAGNMFGVGMASAGAAGVGNATYTSHDIYLLNQPVAGVG